MEGWRSTEVVGPDCPDLVAAPCRTAAFLNGIREVTLEEGRMRPLIRLADKHLNIVAELRGEIQASAEELADDTAMASAEISYDHWLMDYLTNQTMPIEDLHLLIDMVPTKPNWRTRWGGKIVNITVKRDDLGVHSIVLEAMSHREHAKRILIAANPIFPPEIQLPRMWILGGACRTVCAASLAINLGRQFMPGWSTITNLANPFAWIQPLNVGGIANVLPLNWPIQVAFVNPVLDQSRWTSIGTSWKDAHTSFSDVLTDAGCIMRAYTYLTEDEDSPNTELEQLLSAAPDMLALARKDPYWKEVGEDIKKFAAPRRNCVVFSFEDVAGHTGPTGTVADGLVNLVGVTLDNLITPFFVDVRTGETFDSGLVLGGLPVQEAAGIDRTLFFEKLLLTAPHPPRIVWWEGEYSGVDSSELVWHKGSVATVMTGSRSPQIVNALQTFAIKYGLAKISDSLPVIQPGPGGYPVQVPMSNGLDALYNGELDNTLLAWQRFTDPMRALHGGDMKYLEHFEAGSGSAYTLSATLTLRDGNWKTRPWASFKATTLNGFPHLTYIDYNLGDRLGFEHDGVIYVDNLHGVKWKWDWATPITVELKIGEDRNKSDPFGAAFKTIANLYKFAGSIAGEGTLFE